jgi:catechol 2,3-dioxygenase-like lactoylglutathione lyase family enzyme
VSIELNHTIVPVQDKKKSARFLADILGLEPPTPVGPFECVQTTNGVSLDYDDRWPVTSHHYAFLVSDDIFDTTFRRITSAGIAYHASPNGDQPGEIYHSKTGGRGFYFPDPDGHLMEVLTVDVTGRTV